MNTLWICINEVASHRFLSELEGVVSLLLTPDENDVKEYVDFYHEKPIPCDSVEEAKAKVFSKRKTGQKMCLFPTQQKNKMTHQSLVELSDAVIQVPRMYFGSEPDWHNKKVFHHFLARAFPSLLVPNREVVPKKEVIAKLKECTREHDRVVVQCSYSRGGMSSAIYTADDVEPLEREEISLPQPYKAGDEYLLTPFYEHVSLSCTAVVTDTVEILPVRYQHITDLQFMGSSACRDEQACATSIHITQLLARAFQEMQYTGFLNVDLMNIEGRVYVSEINFRAPVSFFFELLLREHQGEASTGYFSHPTDLYMKTTKGMMYLRKE